MANFLVGFAAGCFFVATLCIAGCAAVAALDEWENRHE